MKRLLQIWRGHKTIKAWIERGGATVAYDCAQQRAHICRLCPENRKGNWLDGFTRWLAGRVHVPGAYYKPHGVFTCQQCGCALRLKIQMPILTIAMTTSPEAVDALPSRCWIKHETSIVE